MSDDREDVRESRIWPKWPATIGIIAANAVVYVYQLLEAHTRPEFPMDGYFALSLDGLRHGYLWQFLTFRFMHGGFWHVALNCWAIFIFGRAVEVTIGWKRMLGLYFLSGVFGGMVQMLGEWIAPGLFGTAGVVGASAGAFGLLAAFAVFYPKQRLYMLLFFVIPLKISATTLLWLSTALSLVGIVLPFAAPNVAAMPYVADFFGNVAHAAHLGGIIAGFLLARHILKKYRRRTPPPQAPPPIINPNVKTSLNITPAQD